MKRILLVLTVISALAFNSCNNSVFKEYHEFALFEWKQAEVPKFEFEIIDDTTNYDIYFTLRYVEGFPYQNMIGSMLITDEINKASINNFNFRIRDENKDYIGDVAGNIFDIETLIISDTSLNKGKYKITVEQLVAEPSLAFVMDVGIIVKKSE